MKTDQSLCMASRVARSDDHFEADFGGEVVLMTIEQGNYYELDPICADIWRRLEGQVKVADLISALARDYDADAETIGRDVLVLLERLGAEGLIEAGL